MIKNATVTASNLNLRTQPHLDHDQNIIETLPLGITVKILRTLAGGKYQTTTGIIRNDWHEVEVNGKQGFLAAAFVELTQPFPSKVKIQGVWITSHSHSRVLQSKSEINKALDFLQTKGFNTIFPAVWNRGYTAFPSQVMVNHGFPRQDSFYANLNFDPLQEIIDQAKTRKITVIPWFEYGFAASPRADGGHILQTKPHWAALDQKENKVRHGNLTWMNSLNPQVQQFILALILEVIHKYDVDGIQGDDRLPALPFNGGYDTKTQAKFKTKFGNNPPQNPKNTQWVQFRADILTNFLERLFHQVKSIQPNLLVSIAPAVFPFCLNNLMQDSDTWLRKNIVDFLHPQIYRQSFNGGVTTINGVSKMLTKYKPEVERIKSAFPNLEQRAKFAPGIAFKAGGFNLTTSDMQKCIQLNCDSGFSGQVFFSYEGLQNYEL